MKTPIKKYIFVKAIICPSCDDTIFSRARHDFIWCSCGNCGIDGGFEYVRTSWKTGGMPKHKRIKVLATRQQLYDDWNNRVDKFGLIKKKK